jgi:hypothetical protein
MKLIYKYFFLFTFTLLTGAGILQLSAQDRDKTIISNQDKTIAIYPVPANNMASIRLSSALRSEVSQVEIINLIGRKLAEQPLMDKNTSDIVFTNLNELPEGIYMVVARDKFGKIIQSAKMIINR